MKLDRTSENMLSWVLTLQLSSMLLTKMKDLMMLGWMRRMLVKAGENAEERGYKRIDVEQLIHLDPFE